MIRKINENDIQQICDIYNYYILNTTITFEEKPLLYEEMKTRINDITENLPWFVYEENSEILGYCYASKWKGRCAYRFSVESTVYVKNDVLSKGIGTKLYSF